MKKLDVVGVVVGVLLLIAVGPGRAQESGKTGEKYSPEAAQQAWMKAAQPGPEHALLQTMVGSWEYSSKMWMDPSKPPVQNSGTCERKAILGGRYIYEEINGNVMGMPFDGIGITGYDNVEKKYKTVWLDNMSTTIMAGDGTYDEQNKAFTFEMKYTDALTGKSTTAKTITKIVNKDKQVFEYYGKDPSGVEFKTMEITFTRK
jgi:hypothetical protein